jgi:hypothetical protein
MDLAYQNELVTASIYDKENEKKVLLERLKRK